MVDMTGQIVMVTGATNGLGEVTAHELAAMGATVIVVGRSEGKAQRVVADIQRATGNQNVQYMLADLAEMQSVRDLAERFTAKYDKLGVLVNNAGMLFTSRELTSEGNERTFALNHLNYFLLTNLLLDHLKAAGTPERKARVINVSSSAHRMGTLDFDNLNGEKNYSGMNAYGVSKLENILFTYELARRLEEDGANVTTNGLHPGVVNTGFGKNNSGILGRVAKFFMFLLRPFQISADKGAETQVYLASSPEVEGVTGKYYENKKPKESSPISYDREAQARLWEISAEITGLKVMV